MEPRFLGQPGPILFTMVTEVSRLIILGKHWKIGNICGCYIEHPNGNKLRSVRYTAIVGDTVVDDIHF
jgi:hypothetical protein